MEFEWDPAKDQANVSKHGVAFETAKRIFEGAVLSWFDDRKEYGEELHQRRQGGTRAPGRRPYQTRRAHSTGLGPPGDPQRKAGVP